MTLNEFNNNYADGQSYTYGSSRFLGECVSLVKWYIKLVLSITPQSIGNAKQYWLKRNTEKYLYNNFTFSDTPHRGDIFCRPSGTWGHVGIVLKVTTNYYYTIEQNNKGSKVVSHQKYNINNGFHFLHPNNQTNIDGQTDEDDDNNIPNDDSTIKPNHDSKSSNDGLLILLKSCNII